MERKDIVNKYQRILLEKIAKEEKIYLVMPPKIGRSFFLNHLVEIVKYL